MICVFALAYAKSRLSHDAAQSLDATDTNIRHLFEIKKKN